MFFIKTTIRGRYEQDDNFMTVYSDDAIYTIARNTGNWARTKVGERTFMGQILTRELYNSRISRCANEGTFVLS